MHIGDSTAFPLDFAKSQPPTSETASRPTILGEKVPPIELGSPFIPPRSKRQRIELDDRSKRQQIELEDDVEFKIEDDSCSMDTSDADDHRP